MFKFISFLGRPSSASNDLVRYLAPILLGKPSVKPIIQPSSVESVQRCDRGWNQEIFVGLIARLQREADWKIGR